MAEPKKCHQADGTQAALLHPFTRAFAWVGFLVCSLIGVSFLIGTVIYVEAGWYTLLVTAQALWFIYFAWACWYAAKRGKNPFKVTPFNLS